MSLLFQIECAAMYIYVYAHMIWCSVWMLLYSFQIAFTIYITHIYMYNYRLKECWISTRCIFWFWFRWCTFWKHACHFYMAIEATATTITTKHPSTLQFECHFILEVEYRTDWCSYAWILFNSCSVCKCVFSVWCCCCFFCLTFLLSCTFSLFLSIFRFLCASNTPPTFCVCVCATFCQS